MLEGTGSDADVEDRLLALKRDMGLLGPAESEAPKALEAADDDEEVDVEIVEADVEVDDGSEEDEADEEE